MKRVYIFKDGVQQGSTATKESAVNLIRRYQKLETHQMLRAVMERIRFMRDSRTFIFTEMKRRQSVF